MERQYYIDWLRIIAIILVLFFHTAMIFAEEWSWHINNDERSYLWLEFNFWLSRFRMPLLFFISGFGSYLALRKRSPLRYTRERALRLLIPLHVAIFLVVPPQIFFERLTQGATFTFGEFYPTIFQGTPYPEGNTSWHHMWFVAYLFFYAVAALPIFLLLRKPQVQATLQRWISAVPNLTYALFIIPTALLFTFWTVEWPSTHAFIDDWGYHPYWFSFFLGGYLAGLAPNMLDTLQKHRRNLLGLAILAIVIINTIRWNKWEDIPLLNSLYVILLPIDAWLWLLALVGLGKQYLNRPHPLLAYANQAIYPFYILHQTVIVVVGYYVVTLVDEGILAKYLFISGVSFVLTVALYEYLIRPFRIMQFLFGVKPQAKSARKTATLEHQSPSRAA